jgi:uncharacterized integral membrane protein
VFFSLWTDAQIIGIVLAIVTGLVLVAGIAVFARLWYLKTRTHR